jgi:riboflavin kinase / FMN adenylyltransferase
MIVVDGVERLARSVGRVFVVIGVFDGLHRGHAYLLDALVREAHARAARPTVVTFDHHPDEVITGEAPPLLLDPQERLDRLAGAGVELAVVQHFDDATRHTPYDAFIRGIVDRVELAGFLMTPESSFGYERGGTPDSVAALGRDLGYDVVVVPPLLVDGRPVRSTEIRAAIAAGDLETAERLLGRPYAVVGEVDGTGELRRPVPMACPPPGSYRVLADDRPAELEVGPPGVLRLGRIAACPRIRVAFRSASVAG